MAVNINNEIESIRNAAYAREVRDAIADSLKQMMDVAGNEAKFESYVTAVTDQFLQDHPDAVAPTDEQVKAWCDANGVTTGATAEEAAQIQQNAAAVTSLKSDLSQLSEEMLNLDVRSIADIKKTDSELLVDTYTIEYTDGTSSTFKITNGSSDEEYIESVIRTWMDEHPEATTTVQKGSITEEHLSDELVKSLSKGTGNANDKPYMMQNIGVLYENPEDYDYIAWCPGNLQYDPNLDKYVSLVYASTRHINGTTALFVSYIDPKTYEATAPVRCYTDDGATALTGSTAFWIDDDGTYKMLYKYTDNKTYLFSSVDGGINWAKGDAVSGFSGSPWGITRLSNGRLIFGDDDTKVGIYYSDNGGVNWTQVILGTAGGDYEAEACILELEPGKLIAIARYSMHGIGYDASGDSEPAIVSFSEDYGTSWTAWKKSETITNMNASTCAGRVHNGMVDVFAASRWYWHGSYSNTDYNNTGKTGAITHYTATVENALADNFTNNGILVYANAVGDGSSQDFHSPALAAKGDEILLMWFDRIYPYTEEVTSHYFARGSTGVMNFAPNDDLVSVAFPYSSYMVDKLLKQQYTSLMTKINEIVISSGGTPDVGDDPGNPTSYIFDGCIMNFNYLDSTKYDTENMTLTDTINGEIGTFATKENSATAVDTFPIIRNNSISPSWLVLPGNTLSKYISESSYALSVEIGMYIYDDDSSTLGIMYNTGFTPFKSNGNGAASLGIRSNGISSYYELEDGSWSNNNEMSNKYPNIINQSKTNQLLHAVVTFAKDGTVSIYVNGGLTLSEVIASNFYCWGKNTLSRGFDFYGCLKSSRIYNRILTADEVLNNYNYELQSIV